MMSMILWKEMETGMMFIIIIMNDTSMMMMKRTMPSEPNTTLNPKHTRTDEKNATEFST